MTRSDDDELLFAEDEGETAQGPAEAPWKILIADDEQEIHNVTKLALSNFTLHDRAIQFLHAFSGAEAVEIMERNTDVALILMDVVMESDTAGLDAVETIRNRLDNKIVRVVLRTGQPGQAPEREVVMRYDINDYKEKTELTAKKLFTLVYTSLSLYHDLLILRENRRDLERIVGASATIFRRKLPERLSKGALEVLCSLLAIDQNTTPPVFSALLGTGLDNPDPLVLAGIGRFQALTGSTLGTGETATALERIRAIHPDSTWAKGKKYVAARVTSPRGDTVAIYVDADGDFTVPDHHIFDVFCRNVASALDSAQAHQMLGKTQRELIATLTEAIEWRSKETGNHVRRVGEYSRLLAQLAGLNEEEASILQVAAPLHDAGKIAIPDSILNKPGRHTDEERAVMETHAEIGGKMFVGPDLPLLKAASIVAAQHHERWDGQGYPRKLTGDEIHIFGRITALADVFDALISRRCYKNPWPLDDVFQLIQDERGHHFDPKLVDLFLSNKESFIAIYNRLPDAPLVPN